MITSIQKRDGRIVPFDPENIRRAIWKSTRAGGGALNEQTARELADTVVAELESDPASNGVLDAEQVQDTVEKVLLAHGYIRSAKAYILYRAERSRVRENNTRLMQTFRDICFHDAGSDGEREGLSTAGDTAVGALLNFGSEGARQYFSHYVLNPRFAKAHREGDLFIHRLDYYALATASVQIDLTDLFSHGFAADGGQTGVLSAAKLYCDAVRLDRYDQFGDQSVANFDSAMAAGVRTTFRKTYADHLAVALEVLAGEKDAAVAEALTETERESGLQPELEHNAVFERTVKERLRTRVFTDGTIVDRMLDCARRHAVRETGEAVGQAIRMLLETFNTLPVHVGTHTPRSTLNYGTDTTPEGRMITRALLQQTEEGLSDGKAARWPVQIFRVAQGVNLNPGDPNYDLFRLAIRVCTRRDTPYFSFRDAPFNRCFYREGEPGTEVAYMGDRARVMENVADPARTGGLRRGNLSTTTINLPRIALKASGDTDWFFRELERVSALAQDQLLERFELLAARKAADFPFLMGEGIWMDAEQCGEDEPIRKALRHGTLAIGFTGLSEAVFAFTSARRLENADSRKLGLAIVAAIRDGCDRAAKKTNLNYVCSALPPGEAEKRFLRMDRERFGIVEGVTDREWYTDGFRMREGGGENAMERIAVEAPYHALTNGGHYTAVSPAGPEARNPYAYERLLRAMHDAGVGFGGIRDGADA